MRLLFIPSLMDHEECVLNDLVLGLADQLTNEPIQASPRSLSASPTLCDLEALKTKDPRCMTTHDVHRRRDICPIHMRHATEHLLTILHLRHVCQSQYPLKSLLARRSPSDSRKSFASVKRDVTREFLQI